MFTVAARAAPLAIMLFALGVLDTAKFCTAAAPAIQQSPVAQQPPVTGESPTSYLQQILRTTPTPIDLASALRLAGLQNSQILLARQRVTEAVALRQLVAAQILPTINAGSNLDSHRGVLQDSNGSILKVNRDALYAGLGAFAVGSGTVTVPGVVLTGNVSEGIFAFLISRQEIDRRAFASQSVEQETLLAVARGYLELMRAEGQYSVALQTRTDAAELARLTSNYLRTGEGRKADADRAASELSRREAALIRFAGEIGSASARLCELLHLDPSLRLHADEEHVLPMSIVPQPISLPELLAVALLNRPELQERRVAICQAMLAVNGAHALPFSPTVFIGYSVGTFGGGSNLVAAPPGSNPDALGDPRFGLFSGRQDLDAMAYWTLLNLGLGNKALIDAAKSRMRTADLEQVVVLDRIRVEVVSGYARARARFAQIRSCELAVQASLEAFQEDSNRILAHLGLPLEVVSSLRLLARSRSEYLNAILDYNAAQFELYVAVGQPAADILIRPIEEGGDGSASSNPSAPANGRGPGIPPNPR